MFKLDSIKSIFIASLLTLSGCGTDEMNNQHSGNYNSLEQKEFLNLLEYDPSQKLNSNPDEVLSEEITSADIEFAKRTLKSAYSGSINYPGNTFPELINDLDALKKSQTVLEFTNGINKAFAKFPDHHLKAIFKISKDKFIQPEHEKYSPEIGPNVGKTRGKKVWDAELVKHNGKNVFILSILSFPYPNSKEWDGFKQAVQKNTPKADFVILDMRQNVGGDDSMGAWLAEYWYGSQPTTPYQQPFYYTSAEGLLILGNSAILNPNYYNEAPAAPDQVEFAKKMKTLSSRALAGEKINLLKEMTGEDFDIAKEAHHPNKMKQPLYILMDKYTGSSGESSIDMLEGFTNAKRVGQNTYGAVQYGSVGSAVLPNSSVVLNMGIGFNKYKDGRFIEKKGIKPDIEVPGGNDALQVVYELIDRSK